MFATTELRSVFLQASTDLVSDDDIAVPLVVSEQSRLCF